jgi:hypothetical protein
MPGLEDRNGHPWMPTDVVRPQASRDATIAWEIIAAWRD